METFKSSRSVDNGESKYWKPRSREVGAALCCSALIFVSYLAVSSSSFERGSLQLPAQIRTLIFGNHNDHESDSSHYEKDLEEVLGKAAMPDKTVIITTLNAAWAQNNTMIDIFLESFFHGEGTQRLLKHLIIVCVDQKAYNRCLLIHPHCLKIQTGGVDFSGEQALLSQDYIKMIWRRIKFLAEVLEMNYSFVFTDADVLWFRDPFPQLHGDLNADMQIACDRFNGRPWDLRNSPNAGFTFVRANAKTVRFYNYWYSERTRSSKMADQEVFNKIKWEETFKSIAMNLRFLDTQFFGGFCGIRFTDMRKACTMHATCCRGLGAKLHDLRMILDGFKQWQQQGSEESSALSANGDRRSQASGETASDPHFRVPRACQKTMRNYKPFSDSETPKKVVKGNRE